MIETFFHRPPVKIILSNIVNNLSLAIEIKKFYFFKMQQFYKICRAKKKVQWRKTVHRLIFFLHLRIYRFCFLCFMGQQKRTSLLDLLKFLHSQPGMIIVFVRSFYTLIRLLEASYN